MRSRVSASPAHPSGLAAILRSQHDRQDPSFDLSLPDRDTGRLFFDLRTVLRLSIPQAASVLQTHPRVIEALEWGDPRGLPSWPETVRIVSTYTRMAHIEPHVALERLRDQIAAQVVEPEPPSFSDKVRSSLSSLTEQTAKTVVQTPRFAAAKAVKSSPKKPLRLAAGGALLVLIIAATVAPSGLLQASVSSLPKPLSGLLRSLSDQMTVASAPVRDGHQWIDVDDPRSRRGDKLRTARP
jgi:hypothetical protein